MAYDPRTDGGNYWAWRPPHHGIRGFLESVWHDTIGAVIHGAERLFTTHGASAIDGPGAHTQMNPIPPPSIPNFNTPHQSGMSTLAPQQTDIHNNFSTSNQYQARYGVSGSHF
tara:strand:+ start:1046 stop:1384 length:339 start_codon:yes stop_codon:yes gene_type:complete